MEREWWKIVLSDKRWLSGGVVSGARHASASHVVIDPVYLLLGKFLVVGFALIDGSASVGVDGVDGVNSHGRGLGVNKGTIEQKGA